MKKRLIIFSGFLGSGKTTFLLALLQQYKGQKISIILNDFGMVSVDGHILKDKGVPQELFEITGGSIFCACLSEQLVKTLFTISSLESELVLIESSGMSDPSTINRVMRLARLDAHYEAPKIFCLFDAVKSMKLAKVLEVIPRQLAAASIAVLTKSDVYTEQELSDAEAFIHAREPDLPIVRSRNGVVEGQDKIQYRDGSEFAFNLNREDSRPDSFQLSVVDMPVQHLAALLETEEVLRVKGTVRTQEGVYFLSDTGKRVDFQPYGAAQDVPVSLTVICHAGAGAALHDTLLSHQ